MTNSSNAPTVPSFLFQRAEILNGTCIDHIFVGPTNLEVIHSFPYLDGCIVADHLPLFLAARIWSSPKPDRLRMERRLRSDVKRDLPLKVAKLVEALPDILLELPADPASILEELGARTVALVQRIFVAKKRRPDGWSPHMLTYCYNLEYIIKIRRHCVGQGGYAQWTPHTFVSGITRIRREWSQRLKSLSRSPQEVAEFKGLGTYGYSYWEGLTMAQFMAEQAEALRVVHSLLHGRERKEFRLKMGKRVRAIELAVESNKVKTVVAAVMGEYSEPFTMDSLDIDGLTSTDQPTITRVMRDHFKEWFGGNLSTHPGGIGSVGASWSDLAEPWTEFRCRYVGVRIPEPVLRTIFDALNTRRGSEEDRAAFQRSVMVTPTAEEFAHSVRTRAMDSAPSVSGLSYNMIRLWPTEVLLSLIHI